MSGKDVCQLRGKHEVQRLQTSPIPIVSGALEWVVGRGLASGSGLLLLRDFTKERDGLLKVFGRRFPWKYHVRRMRKLRC